MALNIVPVSNGWKPGQSGNPKGAPRRNERTLQDLARAHTEEAVKTLIIAMRYKGPQQVPAAIAILDRGWGKPKQTIEADGSISSIHLHLIAALETKSQSEQPPTIQHNEPQPANLLDAPVPTE